MINQNVNPLGLVAGAFQRRVLIPPPSEVLTVYGQVLSTEVGDGFMMQGFVSKNLVLSRKQTDASFCLADTEPLSSNFVCLPGIITRYKLPVNIDIYIPPWWVPRICNFMSYYHYKPSVSGMYNHYKLHPYFTYGQRAHPVSGPGQFEFFPHEIVNQAMPTPLGAKTYSQYHHNMIYGVVLKSLYYQDLSDSTSAFRSCPSGCRVDLFVNCNYPSDPYPFTNFYYGMGGQPIGVAYTNSLGYFTFDLDENGIPPQMVQVGSIVGAFCFQNGSPYSAGLHEVFLADTEQTTDKMFPVVAYKGFTV